MEYKFEQSKEGKYTMTNLSSMKFQLKKQQIMQLNYKIEKEILDAVSSKISEEPKVYNFPVQSNLNLDLQYALKKDFSALIVEANVEAHENIDIEELDGEIKDKIMTGLESDRKMIIRYIKLNMIFSFTISHEIQIEEINEIKYDEIVNTLNAGLQNNILFTVIEKIKLLTTMDFQTPIDVSYPTINIDFNLFEDD